MEKKWVVGDLNKVLILWLCGVFFGFMVIYAADKKIIF